MHFPPQFAVGARLFSPTVSGKPDRSSGIIRRLPPESLRASVAYLNKIVEVKAPAPVTRLFGPTEITCPPGTKFPIPVGLSLSTLVWTPMIAFALFACTPKLVLAKIWGIGDGRDVACGRHVHTAGVAIKIRSLTKRCAAELLAILMPFCVKPRIAQRRTRISPPAGYTNAIDASVKALDVEPFKHDPGRSTTH